MELKRIPADLDSAVEKVKAFTNFSVAVEAEESSDFFVAKYHFTVGRDIRNDWKLWDKNSVLYKWFAERGVFHADDMSSIILKRAYCEQKELPFDFDTEVKRYQEYWEKVNNDKKN